MSGRRKIIIGEGLFQTRVKDERIAQLEKELEQARWQVKQLAAENQAKSEELEAKTKENEKLQAELQHVELEMDCLLEDMADLEAEEEAKGSEFFSSGVTIVQKKKRGRN